MKIEITSKLSQISLVILVFFLNACSFIEYEEKPLNINEVHQAAWRLGIKTLYYLRTDSVINGDIGSRTELDCLSCDG